MFCGAHHMLNCHPKWMCRMCSWLLNQKPYTQYHQWIISTSERPYKFSQSCNSQMRIIYHSRAETFKAIFFSFVFWKRKAIQMHIAKKIFDFYSRHGCLKTAWNSNRYIYHHWKCAHINTHTHIFKNIGIVPNRSRACCCTKSTK